MPDLKIKVKKTLMAGDTVYTIGQIFEGTLDTFPKDIQSEYLAERWDLIEVLVTAKGVQVPIKFSPPKKGEHMEINSLFDKNKVESISVVPGTPVTELPSVDTKFSEVIVKNKRVGKKGQPGPSTISNKPIASQAQEEKIEGPRSDLSEKLSAKKKLLKIKSK